MSDRTQCLTCNMVQGPPERNTVMVQAEKLTQTQLFEVFRLLFYWTLGIPIPAVAGPLAIFLPNSRYDFRGAVQTIPLGIPCHEGSRGWNVKRLSALCLHALLVYASVAMLQ